MAINSKSQLSSLSVFFPCFNEEKNIKSVVAQALQVLPDLAEQLEVIVVNDGSQDKTQQVAEQLAHQHQSVRVVNHSRNRGYGVSIRTGLAACQHDWIFYTDGDGQFDIEELAEFIPFTQDYALILGYRRQRAEGLKRKLFTRLYKLYIDCLFSVNVRDIDCAFKLLQADLLQDLSLFSNGAFISAEMLYKLKKQAVQFKELPVNHYQRRFGQATGASLKVIAIGLWEPLKLYLKMKF